MITTCTMTIVCFEEDLTHTYRWLVEVLLKFYRKSSCGPIALSLIVIILSQFSKHYLKYCSSDRLYRQSHPNGYLQTTQSTILYLIGPFLIIQFTFREV